MQERTANQGGFRQPAEWEPHESCWVAWPAAEDLWGDDLARAQDSFVQMCRAIGDGERLEVLVPDERRERAAAAALAGVPARFHRIPYGDIWLRDTAPIFVRDGSGGVAAACFGFNGWGGKYILPDDDRVAARVADAAGLPTLRFPFVLEGGSVEPDGQGTLLTTRQCLLNPNRNPGMGTEALERALRNALGATQVLWLGDGLLNDHTDGHIDTVARFLSPGVVVCMRPSGSDDPNREVLAAIARDLSSMRDAAGRRLEVVRVPSPGSVRDAEERVMPASYVNFYLGNRAVVVPTYGTPWDDQAVEEIAALFPGRRTVGVPALAILAGGGAFHCITQQQPRAADPGR
ncbi:MAG TPA: agmatine deiminase family protein [Myxococcaceae bacterium]|nr:agmatine deiminase family protein [Myxococcaceae bacterium]